MDILSLLSASKAQFRGRGVNHEDEAFTGHLELQPLVGGAAVLLHYRAVLDDGAVAHEEATLLGRGPGGGLQLWPVMAELPVVLPHVEVQAVAADHGYSKSVFSSGPRDAHDAFREEITIERHPTGELTYAHAWGLPGGTFEDRSSCRMAPSEA